VQLLENSLQGVNHRSYLDISLRKDTTHHQQ
jgi:hypothetical protein